MIKHQDAHSWPQTSVPGPIRKWAIIPCKLAFQKIHWQLVSNLKLDVEINTIIQSHEDFFYSILSLLQRMRERYDSFQVHNVFAFGAFI